MRNKLVFIAVGLAVGLLHAEPKESEGYKMEIQVTPLLRTTTTIAGQPIVYPKTDNPEVTAVHVRIPPGTETGWHKHPFPCFAYILSGALDVEIEGGKTVHLAAGQAMSESINLLHNGKNSGTEPVELVMFVMGEKSQPFTERAPE
jgi:quercetin dioxygenase-like cupin family protein